MAKFKYTANLSIKLEFETSDEEMKKAGLTPEQLATSGQLNIDKEFVDAMQDHVGNAVTDYNFEITESKLEVI